MSRKALPSSLWLKKVARFLDDGGEAAIAVVTACDEEGKIEAYDECASIEDGLAKVESREPGHYVLIDPEGGIIAECKIGTSGYRIPNTVRGIRQVGPAGAMIERAIATNASSISDQWGSYATKLEHRLDKETDRADRLQAEVIALKEEMAEMIVSEADKGEGSEWIELISRGLEVFEGKTVREKMKKAAERIFTRAIAQGKLTVEEANRVIPIVNDELENLASGIRELPQKEAN